MPRTAAGAVFSCWASLRRRRSRCAVVGWLVGLISGAIYEIAFHASSFQGTIGKQALQIKVTDIRGERITPAGAARSVRGDFRRAQGGLGGAGRSGARGPRLGPIGAALLILLGLVPYVLFGFAIGLAHWYELQQRAEVAESQLSQYPPVSQTDLEAGRRQVRAALFAVQPFKATISKRIASGVPTEEIVPEELRGALAVQSRNVESVDILKRAILIVLGGDALIGLAGQQLAIVPGRQPTVWVCGYAPRPEGAILVIEDYSEYTSVDEGYLPKTCR